MIKDEIKISRGKTQYEHAERDDGKDKAKKKLAVFGAPRPTLNFCADPTTFFSI